MNNLISVSGSDLEELCRSEMLQNNYPEVSACYELFRRALQEEDKETFTRIYDLYQKRVTRWVRNHPYVESTGEDPDFFVNQAFTYLYTELKGDKFAHFPTIGHILKFMRLCTWRYLARFRRKIRLISLTDLDIAGDGMPTVDDYLEFEEIDERIRILLANNQDYALYRYRYIEGMPPRDIAQIYPSFGSVDEIHNRLHSIRRKLRKDPKLRSMLGLQDSE